MRGVPMQRLVIVMSRDSGGDRGPRLLLHYHEALLLLLLPLNCCHQSLDLLVRAASRSCQFNGNGGGARGSIFWLHQSLRYDGFPVWLVEASCACMITITSIFDEGYLQFFCMMDHPSWCTNLLSSVCLSLNYGDGLEMLQTSSVGTGELLGLFRSSDLQDGSQAKVIDRDTPILKSVIEKREATMAGAGGLW